jgi:solute carrier family 8 (sodium/calcium exchanger)
MIPIYFLLLMWTFMGVGIIADVFMGAIEVITSKEQEVKLPDGTVKTFKVWNATVANLTLMALGSSAPEIILSVIETVAGNFYSGELGPSTIVGSAAFNLFVIVAVCIVAIPAGDDPSKVRSGVCAFYLMIT